MAGGTAAISLTLATLAMCVLPQVSSAHPAKTASDGCHYCRTNCDRWGVPWNKRHCHGSRYGEHEDARALPASTLAGTGAALQMRPVVGTDTVVAEIAGTASVIDGDTVDIHGQRVRIHGIDAPESGQLCAAGVDRWRCGQQAALALDAKIARRSVTCTGGDKDRHGRVIGVCTVGGESLNAWLVSEGWALAYRRYSDDYLEEEAAARKARRGVWRGEFVAPWDWRDGERLAAEKPQSAPAECNIKGNIGSKGDRIYHTPDSPWYARTKIDPHKGERYFCSVDEARAAGWRAPKR